MSLVFIAIPTNGTVRDGKLTEEFLRFMANLYIEYPEHTFWAPMVQDYELLKFMDVEPTWTEWGRHCRTMIERSDEVWVLMFDGWNTSVGVAGEMAHAEKHSVPVKFIVAEHS